MASTRDTLEQLTSKLDESIGIRDNDTNPLLSPTANAKDVGRRALRDFGSLELDCIMVDPDQPRTEFDDGQLTDLAQSIREKGQLQPIRVRWSPNYQKWVIIAGERRFRASKLAGLDTIECHFTDGQMSKTEILEQQLIENLLREDLRPIEEARAFAELRKVTNWTSKELAESIRVSASKVTRSLALLKLPQDIQQQVDSGEIAARTAYELSKLDSEEQIRATLTGTDNGVGQLTVAKARNQVRQRKGRPAAKQRGTKQTFFTDDGWKVTVASPRKGNYHEIEQSLQQALDEVRLRIDSNVQL
jgi:ParB family chromosome partitioning protein